MSIKLMENPKISKATTQGQKRHFRGIAFATKLFSGSHQVEETPALHKCRSVSLECHPPKPEAAGLIEEPFQEAGIFSRQEGAQPSEEDLKGLKEVKKKVYENKEDKDADNEQDQSVHVDTKETTDAKIQTEIEDIFLQIKKDLSSFVEIDLRDRFEEKTEDILTEDKKQSEKEEEPPEIGPWSSWLCCFPIWTKQKKQKEKQE
ncbi:hypothetical protein JRQ81_019269 [Phrynocephalus forsythii]|uniref:Uncharacterized protein n=1 Tax=Phrynocephalus forsythii TaxID=171643 RepID=A0A9Q0XMJ9_9SAUR|nr:hypothetical protein JRQ81_019269 [Phrynocephalus forsythii]